MAEPGYDFFATGRPVGATLSSPVGPVPAPMAPVAPAAPQPGARVFDTPSGSVNQFGTPVDLANVPTGPYAAPGIGAAPTGAPGIVSTWDVAAPDDLAALDRFGGVPTASTGVVGVGAPAPGGPNGAHRSAPTTTSTTRPGTVLAAGIIGIVEGAVILGMGLLALIGYLALRGQLAALESEMAAFGSPDGASAGFGGGDLVGTITTVVLVGAVVLLVIGSGYLVAGIATVRGRRWGAWALLVVSAINVVYGIYQFAAGSSSVGALLLGAGVSGAVVVLLSLRNSRQWLRDA